MEKFDWSAVDESESSSWGNISTSGEETWADPLTTDEVGWNALGDDDFYIGAIAAEATESLAEPSHVAAADAPPTHSHLSSSQRITAPVTGIAAAKSAKPPVDNRRTAAPSSFAAAQSEAKGKETRKIERNGNSVRVAGTPVAAAGARGKKQKLVVSGKKNEPINPSVKRRREKGVEAQRRYRKREKSRKAQVETALHDLTDTVAELREHMRIWEDVIFADGNMLDGMLCRTWAEDVTLAEYTTPCGGLRMISLDKRSQETRQDCTSRPLSRSASAGEGPDDETTANLAAHRAKVVAVAPFWKCHINIYKQHLSACEPKFTDKLVDTEEEAMQHLQAQQSINTRWRDFQYIADCVHYDVHKLLQLFVVWARTRASDGEQPPCGEEADGQYNCTWAETRVMAYIDFMIAHSSSLLHLREDGPELNALWARSSAWLSPTPARNGSTLLFVSYPQLPDIPKEHAGRRQDLWMAAIMKIQHYFAFVPSTAQFGLTFLEDARNDVRGGMTKDEWQLQIFDENFLIMVDTFGANIMPFRTLMVSMGNPLSTMLMVKCSIKFLFGERDDIVVSTFALRFESTTNASVGALVVWPPLLFADKRQKRILKERLRLIRGFNEVEQFVWPESIPLGFAVPHLAGTCEAKDSRLGMTFLETRQLWDDTTSMLEQIYALDNLSFADV